MSSGQVKCAREPVGIRGGIANVRHLVTLTLVMFTRNTICSTIHYTEEYGLYHGSFIPDYYIELDAVACTGCLLDKNEKQRLTGKCIPYMAHDGKVYALHSNGSYLKLTDEIGQEISIEKCIVDILYRFTVRFLVQPIFESFKDAIFVLGYPVSACNDDCWVKKLVINQRTLEEYHAKHDFLLVANNSESMDMIRKYFEIQEDSDELTLVPKNASETPVFSSAGINQLSIKTVINNEISPDCGILEAQKETKNQENSALKQTSAALKQNLSKYLEFLRTNKSKFESLATQDSTPNQEQERCERAQPCPPKIVEKPKVTKTSNVTEMLQFENLNGQITNAKEVGKKLLIALIVVAVVLGLIVTGLVLFIVNSVAGCLKSRKVQFV